jgi:hypothetical protein
MMKGIMVRAGIDHLSVDAFKSSMVLKRAGRSMKKEVDYVVVLIMEWIERRLEELSF